MKFLHIGVVYRQDTNGNSMVHVLGIEEPAVLLGSSKYEYKNGRKILLNLGERQRHAYFTSMYDRSNPSDKINLVLRDGEANETLIVGDWDNVRFIKTYFPGVPGHHGSLSRGTIAEKNFFYMGHYEKDYVLSGLGIEESKIITGSYSGERGLKREYGPKNTNSLLSAIPYGDSEGMERLEALVASLINETRTRV